MDSQTQHIVEAVADLPVAYVSASHCLCLDCKFIPPHCASTSIIP